MWLKRMQGRCAVSAAKGQRATVSNYSAPYTSRGRICRCADSNATGSEPFVEWQGRQLVRPRRLQYCWTLWDPTVFVYTLLNSAPQKYSCAE